MRYTAIFGGIAVSLAVFAALQLRVNAAKCSVLTIGNIRPAEYVLDASVLSCVKIQRDLGVIIDSDLSFRAHIAKIVHRAHYAIFLIFRCFVTANVTALLRAYQTFVRSVLEYATTVWSPFLAHRSTLACLSSIDKLESVQRLFTRRLYSRCSLVSVSYTDRLEFLQLEALELRRIKYDLYMVYKIVHGLVHLDVPNSFQFAFDNRTRGHPFKLVLPHSNKDCRKNCFFVRTVQIWNALPDDAVNATSLRAFKVQVNVLDNFLSTFCKFNRNL